MKFLKLIPVLMILVFVSCSKEENSNLVQEDNQIETRRDWRVVGPGSGSNDGSNYEECNNVTFSVISGMYNQLENVICCNYDSGDNYIEVQAYGVGLSDNLEWIVQGTTINGDFGSFVLADLACPNVGECQYLTFQILDHDNDCKSTFNTEICNNSGPCFLGSYDPDCLPGESIMECLCRKHPNSPLCDDGFGGLL